MNSHPNIIAAAVTTPSTPTAGPPPAGFDALAAEYVAAWNETGPAARRAVVAKVFAPDARYVDPLATAVGHDEIDAVIGVVQDQFPGLRMRLAGPVDAHHDQARFTWTLGPVGGEPLVVGFDVVLRGPDGRIHLVLGFLDQVPA